MSGDLAAQRAAVVLAVVAGIQVMRKVIGLSALADATPDALLKILTPLFERLLDPSPPKRRPAGRSAGQLPRQKGLDSRLVETLLSAPEVYRGPKGIPRGGRCYPTRGCGFGRR